MNALQCKYITCPLQYYYCLSLYLESHHFLCLGIGSKETHEIYTLDIRFNEIKVRYVARSLTVADEHFFTVTILNRQGLKTCY